MVIAAASAKVGAKGRPSQLSDATPWENAMVRTTPMARDRSAR